MSEKTGARPEAGQLEVVIENTVFRNEENGYSIMEARAGREKITVVGTLPALAAGEQVMLEGAWVEHPQYGRQWKATGWEIRKPTTLLGIERYLGSGLIPGIGAATAKLLVQEFGERTLDILSEHPEQLTRVPGIGKKRAQQLGQAFQEQHGAREAMVFLQSYGVSPALAVKISKRYGADAQRKIRENPYRLIDDIEGVGFLTADRIALSLGIPQDSEYRLRAGIKYALQEAAAGEGHTYLPRETLLERAARGLRVSGELLTHELDGLLFAREIIAMDAEDTQAMMLSPYFYAEKEIARYLKLLMLAAGTKNEVVGQRIGDFEKKNGIQFSENQRRAVSEAVQRGLLVITGGPGTGKTTIINCILALLSGGVQLAAPTGRAAKRMSEATGREAKTLHRLLEFSGEEGKFQRDEQNPLDCACVIVDEMSMVDVFLMRSLLRALKPGTKLIMVGDADQLPSVGAGNVLGDILKSGAIPSVRLTDIFRQSGESLIVVNAHRINHGEAPILNQKGSDFFFERRPYAEDAADAIVGLCEKRLPAFLHTDFPARDIQVLSPTKKAGAGVYQLNALLQAALNPAQAGRKPEIRYGDTAFRLGDKVMHVKNNYQLAWKTDDGAEGEGVFNGDVGFITKVDTQDRVVTVRYDDERTVEYDYQQLEELELAYCLSVHKSQGSEFPCVVMPVVGGPPRLLTRNLFYTALTRARKLVVLVGREDAIAAMVRNNHIAARYTTLRQRLEEEK